MARSRLLGSLLLAAAAFDPAARAQTAPATSTPTTGTALPQETLPKVQTGIYPYWYIGDPSRVITRIALNSMMTQTVLSAGDPTAVRAKGAVLRYRKEVVVGTMMPGEATPLLTTAEQQVVYVEEGTGRIDDDVQAWTLRPGYALLLPGNLRNRFTVTADTPLKMLIMTEPSQTDEKVVRSILVRDLSRILYIGQGAHWTSMSKGSFTDVEERFLIVYMGPRTMAGPHAHDAVTEEGWIKLNNGPARLQIGSKIVPLTRNMRMIAPPNGLSVNAAINTSDQIQAFFYFATPRTPGARPPPSTNRTLPNPLFNDSAVRSTIQSVPLKSLELRL